MKASASSLSYTDTLREARDWVMNLFKKHHQPCLHYHNLGHTQQVVDRSFAIAQHYQLHRTECAILEIAAWFHDTGHLFSPTLGHEEVGVARFQEFLEAYSINEIPADTIIACILATKMPQRPASFLEAIICDADTYHLGTPYFAITDALLKKEVAERTGSILMDWEAKTLELLRTHRYHTFFCQSQLEAGKQFNYEQYAANA